MTGAANATDKPMSPIEFKSALVELTEHQQVVIALFDGPSGNSSNVALLSCERTAAASLTDALCSALKRHTAQSDSEN